MQRLTLGMIFFFLGGLALFLCGIKGSLDGYISTRWPSTPGKIVTSEMKTTRVPDGNKYREVHKPLIVYSYTVNGITYTNDCLDFGPRFYQPGVLEKYAVGSKVLVYYNPAEPSTALLEPGVPTSTQLLTGMVV